VYLKRLDIKGFKSFAEQTSIQFEPGINVVVGPNGCGKSNVVDAVRWVLGENNVRNLRGQKGEDIIFCGTDSKRAQGMASVEILIDNGDGFLPLDYVEVNLARKLFRSGESEFAINRARVRMKDVHDLLAGTGLGKKGYAIISQGELDQLLNAQALERRLILEEASGIIKYRQQREEVNRRLEGTAQDLVRLADLLQDMRQRSLDVQQKAEKASLFLDCKQQAEQLERTLMAAEIARLEKELEARRTDLAQRSQLLQRLREQQLQQTGTLEEKEARLEGLRLEAQHAAEKLYEVQAHMAELRAAVQLSRERICNYGERLNTVEADAHKYASQLEKIELELKGNREDYAAQQLSYQELEQQCLIIEKGSTSLEQSLAQQTQRFETEKAELFVHTREESRVRNAIQEQQERLSRQEERKFRLETQAEQLAQQIKQAEERQAGHHEQKRLEEKRLQKLEAVMNQLEESRIEAARQAADGEKQLQARQRELSQNSTRLESLKGLRENYSGYAPGVRAVMQWAAQGQLPGVLGIVGEILEVPAGLEMAIEIAAGRSLENIVVASSQNARQAIEMLKSRRGGRVTCLPLDNLRLRRVPQEALERSLVCEGVLGKADRLVKCQPRFAAVAEYLLGRILVVDSLQHGIQAFKDINFPWTLVSVEGDIINPGGAMSGGLAADRGPSRLQRRAEENRLKVQVQELEALIEQTRHSLDSARTRSLDQEEHLGQLKKEYMEHTLKKDWLEGQISSEDKERSRCSEQIQKINSEMSRLQAESAQIRAVIAALQEQFANLQQQQDVGSSRLEEQKERLIKMRHDVGILKERSSSYREQLNMKKRELENSHKNLLQFEAVQRSYQLSCQEAQDLMARLKNDTESETRKIAALEETIRRHSLAAESERRHMEVLKNRESQCRSDVNQLKASLAPVMAEIETTEQCVRQQELNLARLETELDGIYGQWREKTGDTTVAAAERLEMRPAELRNIKQELSLLREKLEALGPVDVAAIEESQALVSRLAFLEKQYNDLGEARSSLLELLKETERLMAQDFAQFMAKANQSFMQTFCEMFNGGEGRLVIPVGSDLEAGVDIEVKIPGKKVQSLPLLSGGERALTCIAFLFALIRLKPVPFCLLDEIDASLDETNLRRFTAFLQGMCQETQFIVITHRQTTIECANTIYGVTMAEKGISGVYTLSLEDVPGKAG
jgi:chromosome segregation protein